MSNIYLNNLLRRRFEMGLFSVFHEKKIIKPELNEYMPEDELGNWP